MSWVTISGTWLAIVFAIAHVAICVLAELSAGRKPVNKSDCLDPSNTMEYHPFLTVERVFRSNRLRKDLTMFEHERVVYAMNLGLLQASVKDLTSGQMLTQITPATNPPVWILGHIAFATDGAAQLLGLPKTLPETWIAAFAPGSKPMPALNPMPTKAELMQAIEAGHERVEKATLTADPAKMNEPHGIPFLANTAAKTVGDAIAMLMTMHEAFHIGQLSYCRRQMGYPPMF